MLKVMIVDDDRITVGLLQTLLELDGFEVVIAPDGKAALEKARETRPDAFVVDFHLADRDGTELVEDLRAEPDFNDRLIIMASGAERKAEALAAGANYFLGKPFDPVDLVDLLNRYLSESGR